MKIILFIIPFFFFSCKSQKKFESNSDQQKILHEKFDKAIAEKKLDYTRIFKDDTISKNYSVDFMLDKIINEKEYGYVFISEYWIAYHYEEALPNLIERLTNKKEGGLINTADLIIHERIESGDLKFYGHGGVSYDDLFTIAGRANNILTNITGQNFGSVSMYSSKNDLKKLQLAWLNWLKELKATKH